MNSRLENLDLFADNCTADASVDLDSNEFSDLLDDEGNLLSELSGGCDNEGLAVG